MKIALDENLPHALRRHLPEHDVYTVAYMGWAGLKNGELLTAVERAGFELLITSDKGFPHEQNMARRTLAVLLLSTADWNIVKTQIGAIAEAIAAAKPGETSRVDIGKFRRFRSPRPPMPS